MGDGGVGLIIGLGMDASEANRIADEFATGITNSATTKISGTFSNQVTPALNQTEKALLSNRETVRLLSEEMGVHLPRAVSSAVAEVLPGINAIGGALVGAFAIEMFPKFISGVKDATDALGGYTKEVQKAEHADIAASQAALIHFKTIGEGAKFVAETNRALAELAQSHGTWTAQAKAATETVTTLRSSLWMLLGPVGGLVNLWHAYDAAVKEETDTTSQQAALNERLIQQLDTLGHLEDHLHKSTKAVAQEFAILGTGVTPEWVKQMNAAKPAIDGMKQTLDGAVTSINLWMAKEENALEVLPLVEQHIVAYAGKLDYGTVAVNQHTAALKACAEAMKSDIAAQGEQLAAGLAGLIGGRRAQAGVEMVWEIGKGIACLAEGTWPPNPAAIIAAGLHFEAAAQYGILAGKSAGHHHAAAGGGGGGAATYSERGGRSPYEPQTLAEGAASGRFGAPGAGVIVVHGSSDFHAWVATTVTEAANRGYTVVSTSSQRGAPVGH